MDRLNEMLLGYGCKSISEHNAAFRLQLDLFILDNDLPRDTKFCDLPVCAQSEICRKAAVDITGPVN